MRRPNLIAHAASLPTNLGFATDSGYNQNAQFAYCTDPNAVPCPTSPTNELQGWYWFIGGYFPHKFARFSIPYDALYYWTPSSGCTWSPAEGTTGFRDFVQLAWYVQAAKLEGMTPVVSFTNGTGIGGVPSIPDPSYGNSSSYPFASWTPAGSDYSCGVYGIMSWINADLGSGSVTHWEAWNEPNLQSQYNGALGGTCASNPPNPCGGNYPGYVCYDSSYQGCGPLEAAELWGLAANVASVDFSGQNFQVGALTLSNAENSTYAGSYMQQMQYMTTPALCSTGTDKYWCSPNSPNIWGVHDYDDPSSGVPGATADLQGFENSLYSHWGPSQQVWVTEAAVDLTNTAYNDNNCSTLSQNCGPSQTSNCVDSWPTLHQDPNGIWAFGGCVDAIPGAQETGAQSFVDLASASNYGETISQVDWFEFQPNNASTGWDSGFYSAEAGPPYNSPDGQTTQARLSACVLLGDPMSSCSSSTVDASQWSTNQYQAAPQTPK